MAEVPEGRLLRRAEGLPVSPWVMRGEAAHLDARRAAFYLRRGPESSLSSASFAVVFQECL